jgi:hypothetical protein
MGCFKMEVMLTDELLEYIAKEYESESEYFKFEVNFDTYLDTRLFNLNCDINRNAEF